MTIVKERLVIVRKLHYIVIEVPVLPYMPFGFAEAPLVCSGLDQVDNVLSALAGSPPGHAPGLWRGPPAVAPCCVGTLDWPPCSPPLSSSSPASPPGTARDSGSAPAQRFSSPRSSARPQASFGEAWSTVTSRRSRGGDQTKNHAAWDQGERQRMRSAVSWEQACSQAAQELNATLLLQRAVRVMLARKHVRSLRLALQLKAVLLLQRAVRGMLARRQAMLLGAVPVPVPRKLGRRRPRGSGATAPDVDGLLSDDLLLAAASAEAVQQRKDLADLDDGTVRCGRCRRALVAGTVYKKVSCGYCVSANPARRPCLIPRGEPALFCSSARCDSGMCVGCVHKAEKERERGVLAGEPG